MTGNSIYVKSKQQKLSGIFMALLLLSLIFPGKAISQEVSVESSFSRDTVLIGDQLDFTLHVIQPDSLHLQIPTYTDSIVSGLDIIKKLRDDTIRKKNHMLEITRSYRIIVFDTGVVVVNPIKVSYTSHGMKAALSTRPLELVVKSLPVDVSKGIRDIKHPYKMPMTLQEILFRVLVVVLLALIIYLIIWYIRKKKKQKSGLPEIMRKPAEPPHVFALRELNLLKDARLWQQGMVKEYYTRLTDILRKYLEYRYEIKALEQTTLEILESLTGTGFNDNRLYGILKEILETGDLVKFAKYQPKPDVNESMLLDAFVFVNETKESWKKGAESDFEKEKELEQEQEEQKEEKKEEDDHA